MNTTFTCFTCQAEVSLALAVGHIPKCYRAWCLQAGFKPYCTCNSCQGLTTHPETTDAVRKRRLEPVWTYDARVDSSMEEGAVATLATCATPASGLTESQRIGKVCVLCSASKSPANLVLPFIFVGKHRKVMVCKKAHLNHKAECDKITHLLEAECKLIEANGDRRFDTMWEGSDNDDDDESSEAEVPACNGFADLKHERRCGAPCTDVVLWLLMGKEKTKKHFCKPSDALRFVIKYYVKQGVRVSEGRTKKQKVSSKKDEGSVEIQ